MQKRSPRERQLTLAASHAGFIRAMLICDVLHVVQDRRMAAADVSRILDVPAERVSALLHRDHVEFTIDDLLRMIARTGVELRMTKSSPVEPLAVGVT